MELPAPPTASEASRLFLRLGGVLLRGGYAPLMLAAVCLVITMCLGRTWWLRNEQQDNDYRSHVEKLVKSSADHLKASDHPVFLAALLASDVVPEVDCADLGHALCNGIESLLQAFKTAATYTEPDGRVDIRKEMAAHTGGWTPGPIRLAACDTNLAADKGGPRGPREPYDPAHGLAGCEGRWLLIPPRLNLWHAGLGASSTRRAHGLDVTMDHGLRYGDATLGDIAFSAYLEPLARKLLAEHADEQRPYVVQVFYVSREGMLRVWSREDKPLYPQLVFTNVAERHIGAFLSTPPSPDTHPKFPSQASVGFGDSPPPRYLDVTNAGIVQTTCNPHHDRTLNSIARGVLCVDYTAPLEPENAATSPVMDICLVKFSRAPGAPRLTFLSAGCDIDYRALEAATSAFERHDHQDVSSADPYAITLVRRFASGEEVYAIANVRQQHGHMTLNLVLLAMLGIFTTLAVAIVVRRIRRQSLESEDGMLRNLQVGVILYGEGNTILEANDRAEELIGYSLPMLGGNESPSKVSDYFHEQTFKAVNAAEDKEDLILSSLTEIELERSQGHSSRYYIRKRTPLEGLPVGAWLHCYGSPWILSGRANARTFAALSPVSANRAAKLEAAARLHGVNYDDPDRTA